MLCVLDLTVADCQQLRVRTSACMTRLCRLQQSGPDSGQLQGWACIPTEQHAEVAEACTQSVYPINASIGGEACLLQNAGRVASHGGASTSGMHIIHGKPFTRRNSTFQVSLHQVYPDIAMALTAVSCDHPGVACLMSALTCCMHQGTLLRNTLPAQASLSQR